MVEIFKTGISDNDQAKKIIRLFETRWMHLKVNVDLDDRDKVLRVESRGESIDSMELIAFLASHDFEVSLLE